MFNFFIGIGIITVTLAVVFYGISKGKKPQNPRPDHTAVGQDPVQEPPISPVLIDSGPENVPSDGSEIAGSDQRPIIQSVEPEADDSESDEPWVAPGLDEVSEPIPDLPEEPSTTLHEEADESPQHIPPPRTAEPKSKSTKHGTARGPYKHTRNNSTETWEVISKSDSEDDESKQIPPLKRGGRPRGPRDGPSIEHQTSPLSFKWMPEIVAIEDNSGWKIAVEVPDKLIGHGGVNVSHNDVQLHLDDAFAVYILSGLKGELIVDPSGRPKEFYTNLSNADFFLFKIIGKDGSRKGIRVKSLSRGKYLVIVPDKWNPSKKCAVDLGNQIGLNVDGFKGFILRINDGLTHLVIFIDGNGNEVTVDNGESRFKFDGSLIPDDHLYAGPLFGQAPPKIVLRHEDDNWSDIRDIVLVQEGKAFRGARRWRDLIKVDYENEISGINLEEGLKGMDGGWFTARIYSDQYELEESVDFRFLRPLINIELTGQSVESPHSQGYQPTQLHFIHDHTAMLSVKLLWPENDTPKCTKQVGRLWVTIPAKPDWASTEWEISSNGASVETRIDLGRLWSIEPLEGNILTPLKGDLEPVNISLGINSETEPPSTPVPRELIVSKSGKADYNSITSALKAAVGGETIRIYPGIYREFLSVNKNVTIEGLGQRHDEVIVNSVEISRCTVNISNILIRAIDKIPNRPTHYRWTGLCIDQGHLSIKNCGIENFEKVCVKASGYKTYVAIKKCQIFSKSDVACLFDGIYLGLIIECAIVNEGGIGLYVIKNWGKVQVIDSKIEKSKWGILIGECNSIDIINCKISRVSRGIVIDRSRNILIDKSEIGNSRFCGNESKGNSDGTIRYCSLSNSGKGLRFQKGCDVDGVKCYVKKELVNRWKPRKKRK